MKKSLLVLFIPLFSLLGFLGFNEAKAQESCDIESIVFGELSKEKDTRFLEDNYVNLTVTTSGDCSEGITLNPKAVDEDDHLNARVDGLPAKLVPRSDNKIIIQFNTHIGFCYRDNSDSTGVGWGHDCVNYFTATYNDNVIYSRDDITGFQVSDARNNPEIMAKQGVLLGNCSGDLGCKYGDVNEDDQENWKYKGTFNESGALGDWNLISNNCVIDYDDVEFSGFNKYLTFARVQLSLDTTDCVGVGLQISFEDYGLLSTGRVDFRSQSESGAKEYINIIPKDERVILSFKAGNDECGTDPLGPDCTLYLKIDYNGKTFSAENKVNTAEYNNDGNEYLKNGVILGDCIPTNSRLSNCIDGGDWEIISIEGIETNNGVSSVVNIRRDFDASNPCFVAAGEKFLDPKKEAAKEDTIDPDCYELLAPIPGLGTTYLDGDGNERPIGFVTDPDTNRQFINLSNFELGDYINVFIRIGLGILIVMSIIMIIIAGVEYMTIESIYGKSAAKGRIGNALFGLIIGLSIYLILSTINPRLLEVNFQPPVQTLQYDALQVDLSYLNTFDTTGIVDVDVKKMLEKDAFVGYMAHQQGPAGAPAIFYSMLKGSNTPIQNPYYSDLARLRTNVDKNTVANLKGKGLSGFTNYFYKRIIKFEQDQNLRSQIPKDYQDAIRKAADEEKVDYETLITMCMIEAYACNKTPGGTPANQVVNQFGFRGLFQFGADAWSDHGEGDYKTNSLDPYQSAKAAAKMFKANIRIKQSLRQHY